MNVTDSHHVLVSDYASKKTPHSSEPFVIPEIPESEPPDEGRAFQEESKEEEDEKKNEVLIDYFLKAMENKDIKEDTSQSKEEKGAENLAVRYEMSKQINTDFGGRLMSGDALNVPHMTYWIR